MVARRVRYESSTPTKLMNALRIPKLSAIAVSVDTIFRIIGMREIWDKSVSLGEEMDDLE